MTRVDHDHPDLSAAVAELADGLAAGLAAACQLCGCSDERACPGGCYWVLPGLCSQCVYGAILEATAGLADDAARRQAAGELLTLAASVRDADGRCVLPLGLPDDGDSPDGQPPPRLWRPGDPV